VHLLSLSDAKIPSALRPVSVADADLIDGRGLRRARQDGQSAGGRDQPVPRSVAVGRAKRDRGLIAARKNFPSRATGTWSNLRIRSAGSAIT
jgi:hypothetical protein